MEWFEARNIHDDEVLPILAKLSRFPTSWFTLSALDHVIG